MTEKKTNSDIEIPLGKRTKKYRFFEMLPAFLSYGMLLLLPVLSIINPTLAAIYLFLVVLSLLVKAVAMAYRTIRGRRLLDKVQLVDWHARLMDLENPAEACAIRQHQQSDEINMDGHIETLQMVAKKPSAFPKPHEIYNAVMVATYNESFDVLAPTIQAVADTTFNNKNIILILAYEQRGGPKTKKNALRLQKKFKDTFLTFEIVEHPADLPNEVQGKGGNITHAGYFLKGWLKKAKIPAKDVIVTTLDSDNRPYRSYFDYLTYEYITHENRKHLSFQPICLFTSNIWDAPAPMRVIATGNSFWNIISSQRPHTLRNFASHSQPMDALEEMDFWSTRTIVEDGHQYWRSYFFFKGDYSVVPIYVPIYQDAVLSDTYWKTLKAQFVQLRRWDYGASDIPYVADHLFRKNSNVPFISSFMRFCNLVDGHVTLAAVSILVAVGGWVPMLLSGGSSHSVAANQLPDMISVIQSVAVLGILVTIIMSVKLLPPRPKRYKKSRSILMIVQWVIMPIIAVLYNSAAALYSQTRLLFGKYLERFDVTDKAVKK